MKRLALLAVFLALPLCAQDFVSAGAQFNGTTVTPFGAYAHGLGNGIFSIESVQVTQIHLKPQITFQTVTTQDFGYDFAKLLPENIQKRVSLLGIGGAGVSASSTALAGAFDGGGLGIIHAGKVDVVLGARIIKTAQAGVQAIPIAAVAFRWN